MSKLVFPAPFAAELEPRLLADRRETCAVLFTKPGGNHRHLVFAGGLVPEDAYHRRTKVGAELKPQYLVAISNQARRLGAGVVLVHTHPFASGIPDFSPIDDAGEQPLAHFFHGLFPERRHFALVVGPDGAKARVLGAADAVPLHFVGREVRSGELAAASAAAEIYDRQVRAFGSAGQTLLAGLKVAIVGAGGTGSVVAQELAHLGIHDFLLIDHDQIERSNLNRVAGATASSVGKPKVDVTAAMIRAINPAARLTTLVADIVDQSAAARLIDADFIFSCTDSHASRAVIAQIAYQHLVPAIDIGVGIAAKDGLISAITGRVQMLAPGLPCLLCTGALDGNIIRRELMSEAQRAADPYFEGGGEPQPSVMSLNGTMCSLAVTMFLAAMTGMPSRARHLWYDGMAGAVRPMSARPADNCMVCSSAGALARGQAILWFGGGLSAEIGAEYDNRGLAAVTASAPPTRTELIGARGAVFMIDHDNAEALGPLLQSVAIELADHGLLLCIGLADDQLLTSLDWLDQFDERWVLRRVAPAGHEFAEALARRDPGPAENDKLDIRYRANIEPLSAEDARLVRRALADCGSVVLDELGGGLSKARVFRADATADHSDVSWMQPLFIKLDRAHKIGAEAAKYREAASFIPFGLRPNLESETYGARRGALVGNLVEKSESLWDVARRGQADAAIVNLYNVTLGGWRRIALKRAPVQRPILPELVEAGIVEKKRIIDDYVGMAMARGAAVLDRIWSNLSALDQCFSAGPIHGDLHAENVRVRRDDSILIDLALARSYAPIAIDLALLEVWLAFAVHRDDHLARAAYEDAEWRAVVESLYAPEAFERAPDPADAGDALGWLRDCVRQIRMIGLSSQTCPSEYRTAVIVALLRLCMFDSSCRAERFRRMIGYVLASRLTEGLAVEDQRDAA
jgi:hypothetical protein